MTTRLVGRHPATGDGYAVSFADGIIQSVEPDAYDGPTYLSAGLVDIQVNGYFGIDLNDHAVTPDRVAALTRKLFEKGVTTYLPTLITAPEASIVSALEAIAEARRQDSIIAHAIAGVHVEGPSISSEDGARGAHPRDQVRPPDPDEVAHWQKASGDLVRLITLSPHWENTVAFIRFLKNMNIHVSLGHTEATPEQVHVAAEAGAELSTHLGNGAPAKLDRHPNFIWAQLSDDRLTASFIADEHHLPADTLKAMLRAKTLDRAILVSDVAAPGGLEPGIYDQPIGGRVQLWPNGRLGTPGTPFLAGAALPINYCVARAARMTGLPLADTLRLATVNPGRFAGGRGQLAAGQPADLVTFDWQEGDDHLAIRQTFVAGECVWTS